MRIAFLGPAGTFTEDALNEAAARRLRAAADPHRPRRDPRGGARRGRPGPGPLRELDRGLGAQHPGHARLRGRGGDDRRRPRLRGAGAPDRPGGHRARRGRRGALAPAAARLSAPASCARSCPGSNGAASAARPPRCAWSSESERPWAAIGARSAAELYGCAILREGIEDEADNVTRFVWIAPQGTAPAGGEAWKTSIVFSELGEDHPGALVDALREFSDREVNLSRIESRPLRRGLGRYMFFCDLEGALGDPPIAEAMEAVRAKAETVRVLGSYPVG